MPVTVKRGDWDAALRQIKNLDRWALFIGVQGQEGIRIYPRTGVNVATVALYNEFGTRSTPGHAGMPARSFIRGTLFEKRAEISEFIAEAMGAVVSGRKEALDAIASVGRFVAKLVKTRIETTSHWAKRNAPATIARKGFDRPLHETERLARSISWSIRDGNKDGSVVMRGKA
jgi:phage gpG-like protein